MFYVARTYSHTDLKCLWKIESRPIVRASDAESWRQFVESEHKLQSPHSDAEFFIIKIVKVDENGNETNG